MILDKLMLFNRNTLRIDFRWEAGRELAFSEKLMARTRSDKLFLTQQKMLIFHLSNFFGSNKKIYIT